MKIQLTLLIIVLLVLSGAAGCATSATQQAATATTVPSTQPPASQEPPTGQSPKSQETPQSALNTDVVLNMIAGLNSGDAEGSLAYFADDAMVYMMGFPPAGIEIYKGKAQIRSVWQDSVENHFKWEVKVISAAGDLVKIQAKTWHDFTRQLQVAPLEYTDVYQVVDGKIKTYGSWLTEESLARFKPAFNEVMPPEPTATPFSGSPVSEMTVTTADGTCTTDSPGALKAGDVKVNWNVQDQDKSKYALTLFTLDSDKDILDLMVATYGLPPAWGDMVLPAELGPGESDTYTFKLEKGPLYVICWSQPPDLPIGNSGPIPVIP
jgi:ketosteroid isomerase-like protein